MTSREYRVKVVLTKAGESWDSTKTYALLDYIAQTDGVVYVSKKADNTGHELTDTDWWDKVLDLNTYITAMQTATAACTEATDGASKVNAVLADDSLAVTDRTGATTTLSLASPTSVDELYNLVYNILGQGCTMFVVVYASDTSALKINGSWVSIPAGKPTILKDVKTMEVNPDGAGTDKDPGRITRFDIHYNGKFQPTHWSTGGWWHAHYGMVNITALDVSGLDTSEMTSMGYMFDNCRSLASLDLSNFDTQKVTGMDAMFSYCNALTSLDLSNFDTSSVTNMFYMFYNCNALTSLNLSNFDTQKVTNMFYMFDSCRSLASLDLSNFDTSSVTNMSHMFYCRSLTNLIFGSKWGTQTSTAANALTLDLSSCGSSKSYKLTDETYNSMLTMYDRKTAGLTEMTIKLSKNHNIPDGWTDKMVARGYTIVLV